MAAVADLAFTVLAIWTLVAIVVALAVGRTIRRLEPIPVRAQSQRRYPQRVVDLRAVRGR